MIRKKNTPIVMAPTGSGKTMSGKSIRVDPRAFRKSAIITAADGSNPVDLADWIYDAPPPHKEAECHRVTELVLPKLDERASRLHPLMIRGFILMCLTQWSLERDSIDEMVKVLVPSLNKYAASKPDYERVWWR